MKHTTVRQALQRYSANPEPLNSLGIEDQVSTLVAATLFAIANNTRTKERGAKARGARARKMIFERLSGRRRAGTTPASAKETTIDFIDLTAPGEINV